MQRPSNTSEKNPWWVKLAAIMSIISGLLQIYTSFSPVLGTLLALRVLIFMLSIMGLVYLIAIFRRGRLPLIFAGLMIVLIFFLNPWSPLEVLTGYLEKDGIRFWVQTNRIRTDFNPLLFSGFTSKDDHGWCRNFPYQCEAASFELWRSTPPPWSQTVVTFTAKVHSTDWGIAGLEVFNFKEGEPLESLGHSYNKNGSITRDRIILKPGSLGFRVILCGNPKKDAAKIDPFYKSLDLAEVQVKTRD